jgi:uncharacterized delta-60 repeat protein
LGPTADAWLIAFAPDGSYNWFTNVGTAAYDEGNDVAVDDNGNIYLVGTTDGFFDGSPDNGTYGAMLARFDSAGNQVWIQRLAPLGSQFARGEFVGVTGNGEIIVGGRLDHSDTTDAWLGRYAPDGSEIWVREQSASTIMNFRDAHVSPDGSVTVAGDMESANGGDSRAMVIRYTATGELDWTWTRQTIPNGINSWAMGVAIADDGSVFVSGETNEGGSAGQVWLARLTSNGGLDWLVDLGIVDNDHNLGRGLALRGADSVILVGVSNEFGTTNYDTWYAAYGFGGTPLWSETLDIAPLDSAEAVAVNPNGAICMAGSQSDQYPPENRNVWVGCMTGQGALP